MSETLQERQENEIQALKAIFGPSELRDLRDGDAWRVERPPEIILSLTPQQGNSGRGGVHAFIDLHVTCADDYPEKVPKLSLEKSKGLSTQQVKQLSQELEDLAQQLKGEVMIYELAQHVQKYLLAFNTPGYESFYEEMQARQAQQEYQKQLLRQQEQDKERQALQEHIQRKQQALKEEQRRRREHHSPTKQWSPNDQDPSLIQRSNSFSHVGSRTRTHSSSGSGDRLACNHEGMKLIKFGDRQIRRGQCLGHGARGSVVFAAQDVETGEIDVIAKWNVKCSMPKRKGSLDATLNPDLAAIIKQVSSIEQELGILQKLSHPALVRYLAITSEYLRDSLAIYLLQDFVSGVSLSMFLEESLAIGLELLRHITRGILDPLSFLHRNNVVHRDLRHSCVFLQQTGLVMLSDFSLDRHLGEVVLGQERVPCGLPPGIGRGGKKADVHRLGSLLLSLLQGEAITDPAPSAPPGLPPELKDFLEKCLNRDEHERWSAQQLLDHPFAKSPLERGDRLSPQRPVNLDIRRDRRESVVSPEDSESDPRLLLPPGGRSGPSRVFTEFEVLQWLGKGAFGDVLKVKNKLDARVYALKRIKLNPRNKALNKKITREVKLLSRLNHENVVRYYNSWIESAVISAADGSPSDTMSSQQTPTAPTPQESNRIPSRNVTEVQEALEDASVEWSVSCEARPQSDSSSEDEEPWLQFFPGSDSSSSVVFEGGSGEEDSVDAPISSRPATSCDTANSNEPRELQFMYIQMEFCEKSTLRSAIDSGSLCTDEPRVWRLFREMVEGLAHIHQQGMIHRDLKPVNVFLDLHDHVKIGDFGLATTNALHQAGNKDELISLEPGSHDLGDGVLTGQVGTALYTAPELTVSVAGGKAVYYNQKVDIYSLGIIFFEMCHTPLSTAMERVKVLAAIRSPQIIMPSDFAENQFPQQVALLRWLLSHDPAMRPSAQELLRAECLQQQEGDFQEALRLVIAEPQSKAYKHLIGACLDQSVTPAEDLTYDLGLGKSTALAWAVRAARCAVERVFERHGAVRLATPLLMPRSSDTPPARETSAAAVALMTHSGSVITLPHDLRVPFARYVAWNSVTSLKRFSIERVYRERRVYGLHPKELYECAFDIVTSAPVVATSEAELLAVAWEAVVEVRGGVGTVIRINHSSLLKALFLHCGLEEERHADIIMILSEARDGMLSRAQVQTRMLSLLPRHTLDALAPLLQSESILIHATGLKNIARGRGAAAQLAKQALRHLEAVVHVAETLGVKCPIMVAPGLVLDPARYSGLLCQVACESTRSKQMARSRDVIAVGGSYSHLLDHFRAVLERAGGPGAGSRSSSGVSACGISLSLERLAACVQQVGGGLEAAADVVVCALGPKRLQKDAPALARELWASGVRTFLADTVLGAEEAQALCRDLAATHLVLLRDAEPGYCVRFWDRRDARFQERNMNSSEILEWLPRATRSQTGLLGSGDMGLTPDTTPSAPSAPGAGNNVPNAPTTGYPSVNYHFITSEKLAYNIRRRYENQITGQLAGLLKQLSSRSCVELLAVSLEGAVTRSLASTLDLGAGEEAFHASVLASTDKHARHRKYLGQICDKLYELKFEKNSTLIVLYSLPDGFCRSLF